MDSKKKHLHDRVFVYAFIWCISYIGSLIALRSLNIPKAAGIVLTIITVLAFCVFIYKYYRSIFFRDEVQIKIQMEAGVIAFSLGLILLMTLGLLDLVTKLNMNDWNYRYLVPIFIAFYFVGLFLSNRKYNFDNEKQH